MKYVPSLERYSKMQYRRAGNSGLKLPALSLGLWHNFGHTTEFNTSKSLITTAFDNGITHFDLANNYGPPPGAAEQLFGRILKSDLSNHRDEMVISTKAGYTMWDGPYGDWGSKKYLTSSLDQSLKRLNLDYVDIFYHHRPDLETPLEETMTALDLIVKQGKALYIGISNYGPNETKEAIKILRRLGTPCLIHQPKYSLFERWVESELLDILGNEKVGCIPFSPLAQGLLTDKYLKEIPKDSRVVKSGVFLNENDITGEKLKKIEKLNAIAATRNQKLAHMALAWLLKDPRVTSVLIGASKPEQIIDSIEALKNTTFSTDEIEQINSISA